MSVRSASGESVDGGIGKIADLPNAPTIGAATDVGNARAYNDGSVSVAFTPDTTYWPATSYTATSSPGSLTGTGSSSPVVVIGLSSQTAYTFNVKGTNTGGASVASSSSSSVTATTIPDAPVITATPTIVSATSASIPFTVNTGGKTLSALTVTSSPSISLSYSGTSSPVTVSGSFATATSYTFTMTATNANGTSSASSASGSVTPNPSVLVGNYDSIQTVTVGSGGATDVTFSSIPSTYTHLQIRCFGNNTSGGIWAMQCNGITTAVYSYHYVGGYGPSGGATQGAGATQTSMSIGGFGSGIKVTGSVIDILDYTNTNKYKTILALTGSDFGTSGEVGLFSGAYQQTTAISSILIKAVGSPNIGQYSHFALYGIKG